jgi:hypothetical protein
MFILVLVIAIIFIFILISKSPEKIGSAGEDYVDRIIFKNLSEQDYKILRAPLKTIFPAPFLPLFSVDSKYHLNIF